MSRFISTADDKALRVLMQAVMKAAIVYVVNLDKDDIVPATIMARLDLVDAVHAYQDAWTPVEEGAE